VSAQPIDDRSLLGNYFVSAYPPFSCWTETAASDFRAALARRPDPPGSSATLGLYVHIPFCVERCQYCYYLAHDDRMGDVDRYLRALLQELALYAKSPAIGSRRLSVVYFGGGTPSLLSATRIDLLLSEIQRLLPWNGVREATFECAPKSVTESKLRILRDAGITRLSLGVQQMNNEILRANGRIHLVEDVERAYAAVRRVGFDVVNLDLIVGLPGESDDTFDDSLERVLELAPDCVTIYQLEIPFNTPLCRAVRDGSQTAAPASWEVKRRRLGRAFGLLEMKGYAVRSAYAAVRDPSRHGFLYQDDQYGGADLLGIGASAFSYVGGVHQQNLPALDDYLTAVEENRLPAWRGYALDEGEQLVREFVLQLKLGRIDSSRFRTRFGIDPAERFAEPLAWMRARGWLTPDDGCIRLTREGLLRVDHLIPAFYLTHHQGVRYS